MYATLSLLNFSRHFQRVSMFEETVKSDTRHEGME